MMSVEERFNKKYSVDSFGCWIWNAAIDKDGYAIFNDGNYKTVRGHRYSYEIHVGKIAKGLVIDHLCKKVACVNPEHLEPVTNLENIMRGNLIKKICEHGVAHTTCTKGCLTRYHREYKRSKRLAKIVGYN
jgi:hypothetical protein